MSSEAKGWDEFSAYLWLNSPKGKASINWPMEEQVPIETVRQYIKGSIETSLEFTGDPKVATTTMDIPEVQVETVTDLEYLLAPLQEFAERVIDLLRLGLEKDDE